jgi:hypothetical protein
MRWLTPEEQRAAQASHHGVAEGEREEVLLWEAALGALLAAGELSRRQWLERSLEVAPGVEREAARALLWELERQGDVSVAAGGLIAAAPLRAVLLGDGAALLLGTLPSRRLCALLGAPVLRRGALRWLGEFGEGARAALEGAGGVVIGVDQWSEVAQAPRADEGLLDRWSNALWSGSRVEGAGALWQAGANAQRWVVGRGWRGWEGAPEAPWSLARVVQGPRRWSAWVVRAEGAQWVALPVGMDEARRLTFALDRVAGASAALEVEARAEGIWAVRAPRLLPVPEYRALLAAAEAVERGEGLPWFVLPVARARPLLARLREGLGVVLPGWVEEG